ncbi:MAG: GyrI-like domain-containing protein [Methylocystis sp.]
MDVKIIDVEPILVAVLEHRGSPSLLTDSVQRFIAWRKSSGLSPVSICATYGVPYNDPNTTPPQEFRFDICSSVTEPVLANEQGVVTKTIPGGAAR